MADTQSSRRCACGAKLNRWGEHRTVPRYNPAGGGKAAIPGGYERQHRQLFGVGTHPKRRSSLSDYGYAKQLLEAWQS